MRNATDMKKGIAVAGTILVDKINEISAYPNVGELTKISRVQTSVGGCVPNVAIDLKRISPDLTVRAIGKIGADAEGEFIQNVLRQNGVDIDLLSVGQGKTSFTEVMSVTGGQRTFFTYAGTNATFGIDDVPIENIDVKMLHLGYFLLLDKIDNGEGAALLERAQRSGVKTSIDLVSENSDRYALILPCLPYTDNLIVNETEAGKLTGIEPSRETMRAICERLKAYGVKERVIVHCPEYAACLNVNAYMVVPSYDLPKNFIQGTTGAGDAFCAGALYAIHEDFDDKTLLEFASAVAAAALSKADATSGVTSKAEIEKMSKDWKRRKLC